MCQSEASGWLSQTFCMLQPVLLQTRSKMALFGLETCKLINRTNKSVSVLFSLHQISNTTNERSFFKQRTICLHSTSHYSHNNIDNISTIITSLYYQLGTIPNSKSISRKNNEQDRAKSNAWNKPLLDSRSTGNFQFAVILIYRQLLSGECWNLKSSRFQIKIASLIQNYTCRTIWIRLFTVLIAPIVCSTTFPACA